MPCCFWLTRFSFFPVKMLLPDESCNELELLGGVTLYGTFSFHLTTLSFITRLFTVF